jgi:hypothetical protein
LVLVCFALLISKRMRVVTIDIRNQANVKDTPMGSLDDNDSLIDF